ncbi:DUF3147 family protein [Sulfobacillus thermosulfidooxidans]|nr:DUF3147 family protein [Sulfobacillus thermosulfidooxidans]
MMVSIIRFIIGGLIVVSVSLVTRAAPFLSGILSGFPAVFLTSLIFIYLSSGHQGVRAYTTTAIWGMIATFFAVAGTILATYGHFPWPVVIIMGLIVYAVFVGVAIVLTAKKQIPTV